MAPQPEVPSRRRAARRRRRRRRAGALVAVGLAVVAALVAAVVVLGGDDGRDSVATPAHAADAASVTTTAAVPTAPPTSTLPATTTTTEPDPGTLAQTDVKPSATSPRFVASTAALWQAIVNDDPAAAMRFFFPLGAYLQVKAISNPEADWRNRLVAAYTEDIHALHARLGSGAATAQFDGIDVPDAQAVWVQPGAEYNKGSYWRVYGAVVRYRANGQSSTFPIASLISWRGEWYVVHLNSIR